jgi:hypothetical protein
MKPLVILALSVAFAAGAAQQAVKPEDADPPPPRDLPRFWTAGLEDVEREIRFVARGSVETIAVSPGGGTARSGAGPARRPFIP